MNIEKLNLTAAFASFDEQWSPRLAGVVNDTHIKLARIEGDFVWHHHAGEDEMFLVVKGALTMHLRDDSGGGGERAIAVGEGEIRAYSRDTPSISEDGHVSLVGNPPSK